MSTTKSIEIGSAPLAALVTESQFSGSLASRVPIATPPENANPDHLYDKRGAAEFLTIAVRTLDDWRQAGLIKCIKIGGFIRFRREHLIEFLESHTTEPRKVSAYRPRRRKTSPATTP